MSQSKKIVYTCDKCAYQIPVSLDEEFPDDWAILTLVLWERDESRPQDEKRYDLCGACVLDVRAMVGEDTA